jgi:hypothetical protein
MNRTNLKRHCLSAALATSLSLVFAGTAGATIPPGNLLANPGAEDGTASSDGYDVYRPPGWSMSSRATITSIAYGAPGFLTADQGIAFGGGRSFFAGGPPNNGNSSAYVMVQDVTLPAEVRGDVAAGAVQATVGGCLGGWANQNDFVEISAIVSGAGAGEQFLFPNLKGPDANARNNQTDLLPRSVTARLPATTDKVSVRFDFEATSGSYNDGYADNLMLILSPAGTTPPAPNCAAPMPPGGGGPAPAPAPGSGSGSGSGPGTGTGTGSGGPAGPGPTFTPFVVSQGSSKATMRSGRVGVSLECTAHDTPCKGTVRLTVPSLSATASSTTLGSKAFSIAAGKTATVKVSLGRRAKARLNRLSSRQLRRLKVSAKVTIGTASSRFALHLRR